MPNINTTGKDKAALTGKEPMDMIKKQKKMEKKLAKQAKKLLNKTYDLFQKYAERRLVLVNTEAPLSARVKALSWLIKKDLITIDGWFSNDKNATSIFPEQLVKDVHFEPFNALMEEYSEKKPKQISKKQFKNFLAGKMPSTAKN